jgi:hypothetical protein
LDAPLSRQIEISHRSGIEKLSVKLLGMLDFDLGFTKRLEFGQQSIFLQLLPFSDRRGGCWI